MKRVLVTGAGGPAGSNFIKSLRMAGERFYIVGCDLNPFHLELADTDSKHPLPRCDDPNYIEELNILTEKEGIEFIHPQPDVEVAVISKNRKELNARIFLPRDETIRVCQDKMALNKTLARNGVPVARTFKVRNESELKKGLAETLEIYPEKAWLRAIKGAGGRASLPIKETAHGAMWIDYWRKSHGLDWNDFMLSEYLSGREFAFQSLWKNGELVTSMARERLEYLFGYLTPSGQSSSPTVARTVHNEEVNRIATEAVSIVDSDATGVFCIDLKENSRGVPCVTEINAGRFFTTSNFFSEAGVNMPYMYVKLAFSERFKQSPRYNPLPRDLYWIRLMDMGHKLVRDGKWENSK